MINKGKHLTIETRNYREDALDANYPLNLMKKNQEKILLLYQKRLKET